MKDLFIGLIIGVIFTGIVTYFGASTTASNCPCKTGLILSDTSDCGSGH